MSEGRARKKRRWIGLRADAATLRLYPELLLFETKEEREEVLAQFTKQRNWRWLTTFCGLMFASMMLMPAMSRTIGRYVSLPFWVVAFLAGAYIGGVVAFLHRWIFQKPMQRFLREQLLARGVPVCTKCGYDLRGQTEARCPECGTPFDESLLKSQGEQ